MHDLTAMFLSLELQIFPVCRPDQMETRYSYLVADVSVDWNWLENNKLAMPCYRPILVLVGKVHQLENPICGFGQIYK